MTVDVHQPPVPPEDLHKVAELLRKLTSQPAANGRIARAFEVAAKIIDTAADDVPMGNAANRQRDHYLCWLRLHYFAEGSDNAAAEAVAAAARRIRLDRPAPLSEPQQSLYQVVRLHGGAPSVSSIRSIWRDHRMSSQVVRNNGGF